ncbi:MAG: hypothetical protein JNM18_13040 [Planctomycetaceae bacterium]|nr:hypothetical protein [Planctomycetaceae bacterium]
MNTLTQAELKQLARLESTGIVSLYVPQHLPRSPDAIGPTTLKNLRHMAEERLIEHGWRSVEARQLLQPVDALVANEHFWNEPHPGLAIFVGPNLWEVRSMHDSPPAMAWVGRHPYLKPLWAETTESSDYYVLAVHQHGAHLYRGDRYGLEPLPLSEMPVDIRETLGNPSHEHGGRSHTGNPHLTGKESLVFHGQGGAPDARKDEVIAYLRELDRAVHATLGHVDAPVVFVGVEALFPLYREVATIAHLWPTAVHGNAEHWSLAELHARTLAQLQTHLAANRERDVERFHSGCGNNRASANLEEIVAAAAEGQVDAVFVASDVAMWGEFHTADGTVELVDQPRAKAEDLLDRIATLTFLNGGRVHVVPAAEIPGGLVVAAVYRYPRPVVEAVKHR